MTYLHKLLIWSFLSTTIQWTCAQNLEQFVEDILSDYRAADQAGHSDTSRDGVIEDREFALSIYQNADIEGNNDNGVTMNEFVDHYVRRYNISSELAIFMFGFLNDPSSNDNIITANDISLRSFLGRDYASVAEFREALYKWAKQAAERLYRVLANPHIIDRSSDLAPRYDVLSNIDANGDDVITFQELVEEFQRFSPNITRNVWIERNVHTYGAHPVTSILTFDYWDRDRDMIITLKDLQAAALDLDHNGDGRISRHEFLQYFERGYKLSRRMSGNSIQLPLRACPVPWWSKMRDFPSVDAVRATMDFDDDFDGWISLENVRRWLMLFDNDGDGYLSRSEYIQQHTARYGVNSTLASAMFDLADLSGDSKIGEEDWRHHFKDGTEVSFCDVRRSIFDLARMAQQFGDQAQPSIKRDSMKQRLREEWNWYLENEQPSGWMGLGPFGSRSPQRGLCQGQVACYVGAHTKAWGLPGASMWWVSDIISDWSQNAKNLFGMPGPLVGGVIPTMLMSRQVLPLKRATDKPSQHSNSDQTARQVSGGGSSNQARPNNNMFAFGVMPNQYPNMNSKGQASNPFMKQYHQRMFNQQESNFGQQGNAGLDQMRNFNPDERKQNTNTNFPQNPFRSQPYPRKQTQSFGSVQNSQNRFTGQSQGQNFKPTPQPWSPAARNPNLEATASSRTGFQMPNEIPQKPQLPVISLGAYPLVLGVDPSFFGTSPFWRNMERKRKGVKAKVNIDNTPNLESIDETQDVSHREKREGDVAEQRQNGSRNGNETDQQDVSSEIDDMGWDPMTAGFQPSPFDMWMSMVMERFVWESMMNNNDTDNENGTLGEMKDPEELWEEFETMFGDDKDTETKPEESSKPRTERNAEENEEGDINDYRNKRWVLYVQRLRRNPYFHAMRQLWPSFQYNIFPFNYMRWSFRARFPYYWQPYNNAFFAFPWWRRMSPYYRMHMWNSNRMGKRKIRETPEQEPQVSGSESNEKRAFSFDNWFKNKDQKAKDGGRNYFSKTPTSTNAWKSAESSKYGMKNKWGQSVQEQSRQWGGTSKERFDYSNGKWKNNQRQGFGFQNGYASPSYSKTEGRPPMSLNPGNEKPGDMGGFVAPFNDIYLMPPGYDGPVDVAAFWMDPSLPFSDVDWKKRQMTNIPQQNFRGGDKSMFEPQSSRVSSTSNFPQRDWKQQNTWQNNWQSSSGGTPWRNANNLPNMYGMLNNGIDMWRRRMMRKSGDEVKTVNDNDENTDNLKMYDDLKSRIKRSVEDVEVDKITKLKTILREYKERKKSSLSVSKWMPWQSWKLLRNKKTPLDDIDIPELASDEKSDMTKFFMSQTRQKRSVSRFNRRWSQRFPMQYDQQWNWMWYPSMNSQYWNPSYRNFMRFPRESDEIETEINDMTRTKRDVNEIFKQRRYAGWNSMRPWYGNWNMMYNSYWNPWYNQHLRNWMRYPRDSVKNEDGETKDTTRRERRDADESEREKRWSYDYPMWNENGWNWNMWMNYRWNPWYNMRFARTAGEESSVTGDSEREKRDVDESQRQKRFGWWNGQRHWNGVWNPSMYSSTWNPWHNSNGWNWYRHPRNSDENDVDEMNEISEREKREVDGSDRMKRWHHNNPKGYGNGWDWNPLMHNQWNNWYQNFMRFPRQSNEELGVMGDSERVRRDIDESLRQKRFGWRNGQVNWNGMWNPSVYYSNWNPWYSRYRWNWYRYPRNSAGDSDTETEDTAGREKRKADDSERIKRWGYASPMWNRHGWYLNQGMHYQGNPWYNNFMRFPRKAVEETDSTGQTEREKREAVQNPRQKRWMMYPGTWQNMRYSMWNPFMHSSSSNPWYNRYRWNFMRYRRQNTDVNENLMKDSMDREKRDTEETLREKRWSYNHPMWNQNGWNWNQWMYNQWNPWYGMRFARTAEGDDGNEKDTEREKRDADDSLRQKRFGWWNRQGNWNGMWNPSMYYSSWNPWSSNYGWNWMRYPRNSAENDGDEMKNMDEREKRDADKSNIEKRWSFGYPMGYGNRWSWSPWMYSQWNPWYNNYMRFPRQSGKKNMEREKRNANESPREKRFGWSNGQNNAYGMWNQAMYNSFWNPWFNSYRWNWMRHPRQTVGQDGEEQIKDTLGRDKREVDDSERTKRWYNDYSMNHGNSRQWNPWMYYQWGPWYNNFMRFPRQSDEEMEDIQATDKAKRDTGETTRPKRFGGWMYSMMWNQMPSMYRSYSNPWFNRYRWNFMRYPRNPIGNEEDKMTDSLKRSKRDVENSWREKRWNYNNPMGYGTGRHWNSWMNRQWNPWYNDFMRFQRQAEDEETKDPERQKRDSGEDQREKRFGDWRMNYPWGRMWNPSMFNSWNPWYNRYSWNRHPRDSAENDGDRVEREKREAAETDRTKRWSYGQHMWNGNGWNWNPGMNFQWNPWNNFMRFPRMADKESGNMKESEREKRDINESQRQKRFGWWNGQGNWNGMLNPSMYYSNWNPWYNRYRWNFMRYQRNSNSNDGNESKFQEHVSREKRDVEEQEREKGWSSGYPMGYGNRWYWNPWMYNQWNPWYNHFMRFPRQSEEETRDGEEREKRDANELLREKRFGWWNSFNNWNGMWNQFVPYQSRYPWYSDNGWTFMRYPRNSMTDEEEKIADSPERSKRDAENTEREKRWSNGYQMGHGFGWNPWMNYQWNPWYNNFMRFPRKSGKGSEDTNKERRETEETDRQRRFSGWMYPMMYPWNRQGNRYGMWNSNDMYNSNWNPWNSWYRWNYQRYPRKSEENEQEKVSDSLERNKREAHESGREKRWSYGYPMWQGNGWNWRQRMQYPWNSWHNNVMRFPRQSQENIETEDLEINKRDTEDEPRQKRFVGWMYSMMNPWFWQNNWFGMWNSYMYRQNWNPWYNHFAWNFMRSPRTSKEGNEEKNTDSSMRNKRDVEEAERIKRWNYDYPMGYGNRWYWNPMMNNRWNAWYNNFMRFSRQADEDDTKFDITEKEKRDASDNQREKRWNGYWQGNWNGMWNPSMYYSNLNPWFNRYRWNWNRFSRHIDEDDKDSVEDSVNRDKREAENSERIKRWNFGYPMGSNWNRNPWMNYQWNPWYNNFMRFSRNAEEQDDNNNEPEREKRDANDSPRQERSGRWNGMFPWNFWYNNPSMHQFNQNPWYNRYRWNFMRYRRENAETDDEHNMDDSSGKEKREAVELERNKRWNYHFRQWNGWNPWMYFQWNPWNNFMRFPRGTDEETVDIKDKNREKRDTEDTQRHRRFGGWMSPWSWQRNWCGVWEPWCNRYRWNWNRYQRRSLEEDELEVEENTEQNKRESNGSDKEKRWSYNYPMWNQNRWNWSPWMYNQWNPWYSMRFARTAEGDDGNEKETEREKRDADDSLRQKRFGWWNRQGNWNGMWNSPMYYSSWNPWSSNYGWNWMRYPRNSVENDGDEMKNVEGREKRDADKSNIEKRWSFGYPIGYGNRWSWSPRMYSQWNPWYNNYMRFPRKAGEEEEDLEKSDREKRDTRDTDRQRRFGGWMNSMMYPRYWQGYRHGMWNPWYNRFRWNSNMRFSRNSETDDDNSEDSVERNKRDAEDSERIKRWNGNDWDWNPWMYSQWDPWYNDFMRFPRDAEIENVDVERTNREERDTTDDSRQKRWNMMPGMWNPSMRHFNWNPWYNGFGWNNNNWNWNRYPRQSAEKGDESNDGSLDRTKREADDLERNKDKAERTKRWNYPMGYRNGWFWNHWRYDQWNPWYNNFMRFSRESEAENSDLKDDGREERQADESQRPKRFAWWIMRFPWHWQSNWNRMWNPSMQYNNWNPWRNYYRWNSMRYTRTSDDDDEEENSTDSLKRSTRDAGETERTKRWYHDYPMGDGNGWGWNPWWFYQSNPLFNNFMRFPRKSGEDVDTNEEDIERVTRDVSDSIRQKRFGWWNGQGNWNDMWNSPMYYSSWNPWYRWNSNRYPRNSAQNNEDEAEDVVGREKRDATETERMKRWNHGYPMGYGNGWNWNSWMYNQWNPWYNNFMRFPRQSDEKVENDDNPKREKRDTNDSLRQRRFGWWNRQGSWGGMWNPSMYNPFWNQWNWDRYPRNSAQKDESENGREERDADESEKVKRWSNGYPMGYGNGWHWNRWMFNQWNPWYNNFMRFPRKTDEDVASSKLNDREEREAVENPRPKRWNNNMMYPWKWQNNQYGMWNPSMYGSNWNPWYNRYRWNFMRFRRNQDQNGEENGVKNPLDREKRDVNEPEREKRWGYGYPTGYGKGWHWNPWMQHRWNPWYNNFMRFPRNSEENDSGLETAERNRRDTSEIKKTRDIKDLPSGKDATGRLMKWDRSNDKWSSSTKNGKFGRPVTGNDMNMLRQLLQKGEKRQNFDDRWKDGSSSNNNNMWMKESDKAGETASWAGKWRRWMSNEWSDKIKGNGSPWFGPRNSWQRYGQNNDGFQMNSMKGYPYFPHRDWWFNSHFSPGSAFNGPWSQNFPGTMGNGMRWY